MKRGLYLKWLKRLRKQKRFGVGVLRRGSGVLCPLGVLCEAAELKRRYIAEEDMFEYTTSRGKHWYIEQLPNGFARLIGMERFGRPTIPRFNALNPYKHYPSIVEMTDHLGWGPKRVADYIRDHRKLYIKELT
jgi:hypothetical protein